MGEQHRLGRLDVRRPGQDRRRPRAPPARRAPARSRGAPRRAGRSRGAVHSRRSVATWSLRERPVWSLPATGPTRSTSAASRFMWTSSRARVPLDRARRDVARQRRRARRRASRPRRRSGARPGRARGRGRSSRARSSAASSASTSIERVKSATRASFSSPNRPPQSRIVPPACDSCAWYVAARRIRSILHGDWAVLELRPADARHRRPLRRPGRRPRGHRQPDRRRPDEGRLRLDHEGPDGQPGGLDAELPGRRRPGQRHDRAAQRRERHGDRLQGDRRRQDPPDPGPDRLLPLTDGCGAGGLGPGEISPSDPRAAPGQRTRRSARPRSRRAATARRGRSPGRPRQPRGPRRHRRRSASRRRR